MFSESPPSYRAVVEPALVKTGLAIPVWWDEVDTSDPPPPQKQMEGLTIPTFPQLYKKIKGKLPSGKYWEAYQDPVRGQLDPAAHDRAAAQRPAGRLRRAAHRDRAVNHDKDFAAEAQKTIEFVPDYPTAPGHDQQVRRCCTQRRRCARSSMIIRRTRRSGKRLGLADAER